MSENDAAFEGLWRHLLDHWDDEAAHRAFLTACQGLGKLPDAAARYRGMTGDPARKAVAEQKLQAVVLTAMAALETERSARPSPRKSRLPMLLAGMVISLFLLMAYLLLR
ncbi:MAG TPA: hypothetical protein VLC09_17580 [Polyangiaceae bacterium]|nr:hypothetical protein [Polyangiaceae bacterium]